MDDFRFSSPFFFIFLFLSPSIIVSVSPFLRSQSLLLKPANDPFIRARVYRSNTEVNTSQTMQKTIIFNDKVIDLGDILLFSVSFRCIRFFKTISSFSINQSISH